MPINKPTDAVTKQAEIKTAYTERGWTVAREGRGSLTFSTSGLSVDAAGNVVEKKADAAKKNGKKGGSVRLYAKSQRKRRLARKLHSQKRNA